MPSCSAWPRPTGGSTGCWSTTSRCFNAVNGTLGHAADDALLRDIAERLRIDADGMTAPDNILATVAGQNPLLALRNVVHRDDLARRDALTPPELRGALERPRGDRVTVA